MDIPDVLAALSDPIGTVAGLEGVSYPALNHVPSSPWAMIRQSEFAPTVVEKRRAGQQVTELMIDIVLLVASSAERPQDKARIDPLIHPVLDLFDANANGGNVNAGLDSLDGSVDRIWQRATVRRMPIKWGESGFCYAAILTLDALFKRKALA